MSLIDDPSVREFLRRILDEGGLTVIGSMPDGEITDEKISEITDIKLNSVRKTLYTLYENRMAGYRRERDNNTGWLTYLWKIDFNNIDDILKTEIEKLITNLEKRLEFERENLFYVCRSGCGRFIFDLAAEESFKCPFCDAPLDHFDNMITVETIERKIAQISDQ
ncbi:MAG: transcription factor E [Halobacteriota archaeon]|nr:transcription factor E [Halobacteriota archaeon]